MVTTTNIQILTVLCRSQGRWPYPLLLFSPSHSNQGKEGHRNPQSLAYGISCDRAHHNISTCVDMFGEEEGETIFNKQARKRDSKREILNLTLIVSTNLVLRRCILSGSLLFTPSFMLSITFFNCFFSSIRFKRKALKASCRDPDSLPTSCFSEN